MEKQLLEMMNTACHDGVAVCQRLADDVELFVYPLQRRQGLIIGVGHGPQQAHQVDIHDLLQRRTRDIARFGPWMPAVFTDGSHFVVMRVDQPEPDEVLAATLVNHIHTAKELLS